MSKSEKGHKFDNEIYAKGDHLKFYCAHLLKFILLLKRL